MWTAWLIMAIHRLLLTKTNNIAISTLVLTKLGKLSSIAHTSATSRLMPSPRSSQLKLTISKTLHCLPVANRWLRTSSPAMIKGLLYHFSAIPVICISLLDTCPCIKKTMHPCVTLFCQVVPCIFHVQHNIISGILSLLTQDHSCTKSRLMKL